MKTTNKLKIKLNRRAVSPIIATLLLVAIAVAAAVVTYTWTMSMAQNQSTQSQTNVKIDQVMFGKATAASTTVTTYTAGGPTLTVANVTGFSVGDIVKVHKDGVVLNNYPSITAINTGTNTLTINTALTLESGKVEGDVTNASVTKVDAEGMWISVRNTGSIATTIEKVYIYEGNTLLTPSGISINRTLAPNTAEGLAIIDTGESADGTSYYNILLSGGQGLPSADYTVEGDIGAFGQLDLNKPYTIKLVTSTGFTLEGTFYTPGSW